MTTEGEQVRGHARQLQLQHAQPLRALGDLEAAELFDRHGISDFHRRRVRYTDARNQGDILNPKTLFHEFLEATVQIATVGPGGDHLVTVHLDLQGIVALDAGVVGSEVDLELVARRMVSGFVVFGAHRLTQF